MLRMKGDGMERYTSHEVTSRYEFMMESVYALGRTALDLVKGEVTMWLKPDGTKVTSVDEALNQQFIHYAGTYFPEDLVWGEEASNSEKGNVDEANQRWMWTIDPIDGTSGFWRSYTNQNFKDCCATTLISGFAPGDTSPSLSVVYNPFQEQGMVLSTAPSGAFYQSSSMEHPIHVQIAGYQPTRLEEAQRYEYNTWKGSGHSLENTPDLMPVARRVKHQLFMASVALGDTDLTAFPGPSNPHDVAPAAHIVHVANGGVRSLGGESFEAIDWRLPIDGVVAAVTPELADDFVRRCAA